MSRLVAASVSDKPNERWQSGVWRQRDGEAVRGRLRIDAGEVVFDTKGGSWRSGAVSAVWTVARDESLAG